MKRVTLFLLVVSLVVFYGCSQNTNKPKSAENSGELTETANNNSGMKLVKPAEMLPEIESKYSGIKVAVVNKKNKKKTETEVPFNKKTALKGSDLELEVTSYFTDFVMANGVVVNRNMDENNPAAKIVIYKSGIPVFDGWLFQLYPDMHSFEDPELNILMVGGVKK